MAQWSVAVTGGHRRTEPWAASGSMNSGSGAWDRGVTPSSSLHGGNSLLPSPCIWQGVNSLAFLLVTCLPSLSHQKSGKGQTGGIWKAVSLLFSLSDSSRSGNQDLRGQMTVCDLLAGNFFFFFCIVNTQCSIIFRCTIQSFNTYLHPRVLITSAVLNPHHRFPPSPPPPPY